MVLARRLVRIRIPVLMAARTAVPAFAAQDDSLPSAIFAFESMLTTSESNSGARRSRCHDHVVTQRPPSD
jgi:hypothetical protein